MFLSVASLFAQRLVLPGDHPDPTVIRAGNDYWASNTSAEWLPVFPLYRSTDLIHWQPSGAVFQTPPTWASGNFWAPELANDGGDVRVYYAARKRGGPLCVAVAEASKPQGPYQDHGPLVCQPDGSIDPFFIRDENGAPYLIWKEDGNSQQQPTWIWAQPLTEDGLALKGTPRHLIRNDAPWEGAVVEGPDILRHAGWFYLFYAGGACCGSKCNYAVGVARSRRLLGPWEKDPHNPIEAGGKTWSCPGHGTVVQTAGGAYEFLHHAYPVDGSVYVGRESVIDEVRWDAHGWPSLAASPPSAAVQSSARAPIEEGWQWPLGSLPSWRDEGDLITLRPNADQAADPFGAVLAKSVESLTFNAFVSVTAAQALAGLAVIGDRENALGIGVRNGEVIQFCRIKGNLEILARADAPAGAPIRLKIGAAGATDFVTEFSANGEGWTKLGASLTGGLLPPWDRGLRIGLICGGGTGAQAEFQDFRLIPVIFKPHE